MPEKVEVRINPIENSQVVEVITVGEIRERYNYIGSVSNMLERKQLSKFVGIGTSAVLTVIALTELSKPVFSLISADPEPLIPILEQVANAAENPLGVGILAAIGAYYVGKSAFRNRTRFQAINDKLHQVQISSTDPPPSPSDQNLS